MDDGGGRAGIPAVLRRSSSSASTSWNDSTIHSSISVKYDVNASALSVDATGSVGVLGARKGLYVIDLESPYQPARTLHHQTKWDVTVVKCNPHVLYKGVVASTSNHNTLLWNMDYNTSTHIGGVLSSHQPLMSTLRAHTRPVSDVAWSPSEPTVLASSSADTTTHLWDIRTPQKPAQSLFAFTTSATQVEWNRLDAYSLATAHAGEVRLWDTRACDKPTVTITAHMQKIHGIDWSPTNMYELVTCSEDKTVKFWNVMRPRVCQGTITTGAPVWRARYTPFGDGLITSFHRQDYFLRLWSLARDSNNSTNAVEPKPVFDFFGHKDLVRGFAWRQQPGGGVFQLISWGKQQELRMWKIDPVLLEACGYVRHQVHHQYLHQHHNSSIDLSTLDEIAVSPYEAPPPQPSASMNGTHGPRPGSHVNLSAYKFDLGCLKADFIPLPLPPPPVSSNGAYEMTHATASATMPVPATQQLVHRHDVMMDVEEWHPGDALTSSKAVLATNGTHGLNADDDPFSSIGRLSTPTNNATVREPIRRVSGGCFSGPNCLVYFDSRVAIGQSKVLHTSSRHLPLPSTTNSTNSILPQTTTPSILSRQFLTATSPSFLWTSAQPPPTFAMTSIGATTPRYNSSSTFVTSTPHHASRSNHVLEATHHFDVAQDDYDELDTNDAGSRTLDTMTGNHHLMQHSPPFPSRRRHPHLSLGPSTATNGGAAPANNPTANGKYLASLDSTLLLRVKILDCSTMCHSHSPPFCHRSPLVTTPAAHAKAAIAAGDVEQGQMWSILAVSTAAAAASPGHLHHENRDMKVDANKFVPTPWHAHPFGSSLVQHVLELFEAAGDVPTLAAIVCAVSLPSAVPPPSPTDQIKNLQSSVLSTVRSTGSTGAPPTSVITTALSSQPQATESMKPTALTTPSTASTPTARRKRASTLLGNTDADVVRYDGYKLAQADLLYRQGATNARCELLKHLQSPSEPHVGLTLAMYCCKCGRPCDELYCNACKGFSVQCAVCELVVRGQSMFCFKCGHGGHSDHIVAWFATENACPTGCGCWCKQVADAAKFQIPPTPTHIPRPTSNSC